MSHTASPPLPLCCNPRIPALTRLRACTVFLTKLEYYQGTIFLTTNRVSSVDHAFRSRVDLLLPYPDLDSDARLRIWENFVERTGRDRFDIDEEALERLAQFQLNGREIKNLVKSVQLLSLKDSGKIPSHRLEMLAGNRAKALSMF